MDINDNKYYNLKLFSTLEDNLKTFNNLRRVCNEMLPVFDNLKDATTGMHLIKEVMISTNKREAVKEYLKELSNKLLTLSTSNLIGFDNETKYNFSIKVQDVLIGLLSGAEVRDSDTLFKFFCTYMFGYNIDFIKAVCDYDYNQLMVYLLDHVEYTGEYEIADGKLCVGILVTDFNEVLKGDVSSYLNEVLTYLMDNNGLNTDFFEVLMMKA